MNELDLEYRKMAIAIRDSLMPKVMAYAQREGLNQTGMVQAALRMAVEETLKQTSYKPS